MITNLLTLAGGALVLGFLHGLIPNHWMPFVLLGHDRGWTARRMMLVTLVGGIAHLASTVLIGVVIGSVGVALSNWEGTRLWFRWGAPLVLIAAGLWVWARGHGHVHRHRAVHGLDPATDAASGELATAGPAADHEHEEAKHAHGHEPHDEAEPAHGHEPHEDEEHAHGHVHACFTSSDLATVGALLLMMFLSPCVELDSYYVVAVQWGWLGIGVVSAIYLVVTTGVMVTIVGLAARGLERVRLPFIERYETVLSGALLIILGLAWLLFPFEHEHGAPTHPDERHSHAWIMPAKGNDPKNRSQESGARSQESEYWETKSCALYGRAFSITHWVNRSEIANSIAPDS
jgi:ABC-type nickel/cobalt efflux system permease component RcnA